MELALIGLAIAPGISIAFFIYFRDKYEKEPFGLLLKCFTAGFFIIIPAALIEVWFSDAIALESTVIHTALNNFLFVGLTEEVCKYYCLYKIAYPKDEFNEPFDGIVYAVMVSMGFATSENLMYVFQGGFGVGILRIFTAVPAHAAFAVLMGYFVGLAKFKKHHTPYLIFGLATASIFHGAYDFFLSIQNIEMIALGALVSLIIAVRLSFKAMKILNENSPFKYSTFFSNRVQPMP
jgi:protease PrsW